MNTTRTALFLMANLGSEVSKIISAKEKKDFEVLEMAMKKAQSIITELKKIPETETNTEIDILEDIITDLNSTNQKYHITPAYLKSYFSPFSLRLMQV